MLIHENAITVEHLTHKKNRQPLYKFRSSHNSSQHEMVGSANILEGL